MMDTITGVGTAISLWDGVGALITLGTIHGITAAGMAGIAHGTIADGIHRGTVDGTVDGTDGTVHGITVAGIRHGIMVDGMILGIMVTVATAGTVVVITMGSTMATTAA